jgi:hypothetical protein
MSSSAARYAWTRPWGYRALAILGVSYTVVVAIDDAIALKRWLFGLVIALVGRAMMVAAPKTSSSRTYGREGLHDPVGLVLRFLPLPVARRTEFVMGAILMLAGIAIAVSSVLAL